LKTWTKQLLGFLLLAFILPACKFILVRLELNHTVAKIRLALEKMPGTNTLAYSAAMSDMGTNQQGYEQVSMLNNFFIRL
jgi:hypothetical protein